MDISNTLRLEFSLKKSCLYFLIFPIVLLGAVALVAIFVLKPREPVFSLQTLKLDSYKLDVYSESTLFVSSAISMTLNSWNPNRVGISYSDSRFYIFNQGLVIGMILIPEFHHPPHSYNVTVQTKVMFDRLNVTQLLISSPIIRISGDIRAHVRIFRITLPKLKVALDCDVNVDHKYLSLGGEQFQSLRAFKSGLPAFAANPRSFAKNCSVSFYI